MQKPSSSSLLYEEGVGFFGNRTTQVLQLKYFSDDTLNPDAMFVKFGIIQTLRLVHLHT